MITLLIGVLAFVTGMLVCANSVLISILRNYNKVTLNSKRVEDALIRAHEEIEELRARLKK